MRILAALLLLLLVRTPARAHGDEADAARPIGSTASFLRLGAGGRAAGLGEAFTAVADDATALYWNPAALSRIEKRSATLMRGTFIGESTLDYAAFGMKVGPRGAVGLALQHLSSGKITTTDELGFENGTISPSDLAVSLGGAYTASRGSLEGFAFGAAIKYVRSTLIDTAQATTLDMGVLSRPFFNDRFRVGGAISNFVGALSYGDSTEGERLPLVTRFGTAFRAHKRVTLSLDGVKAADEDAYAAVGGEFLLTSQKDLGLVGRVGFNTRDRASVGGTMGLSAGVGLGYKGASFDYGFVPMGYLGTGHRASVSFAF